MNYKLILLILLTLIGCGQIIDNGPDQWKNEIESIEVTFQKMTETRGIKEAFLHFASDSAVLIRSNQVIKGKKAIAAFFDSQSFVKHTIKWYPDFIDVSSSGDMAYTYGKYRLLALDTAGLEYDIEGIFHTVWKRQPNGEWKYVYD